jgi:hypothetical protein
VHDLVSEWNANVRSKLPQEYLLGFMGISSDIVAAAVDNIAEHERIWAKSMTLGSM